MITLVVFEHKEVCMFRLTLAVLATLYCIGGMKLIRYLWFMSHRSFPWPGPGGWSPLKGQPRYSKIQIVDWHLQYDPFIDDLFPLNENYLRWLLIVLISPLYVIIRRLNFTIRCVLVHTPTRGEKGFEYRMW